MISHRSLIALSGAVLLIGASIAACGSDRRESPDDAGAVQGPGGPSPDSGLFTPGDGSLAEAGPPRAIGYVQGRVVAPEGTVPVSGAILYLTDSAPEPIPANVYCDTCIKLSPLEPYTYSKPDGSFDLPVYRAGKQLLVVQKGQFRRVREVLVTEGEQRFEPAFTRLPGKTDAARGDTIPKIAMAVGGYDKIDYSMKKLGIEEFYRYGDGPIQIGPTPPGTKVGISSNELMGAAATMSKYHIVLLPCASFGFDNGGSRFTCGAPTDGQKSAFRSYVEGGGKLYVTDYSYEAVRQTWPGFISWYDDRMQPLDDSARGLGTACRGSAEDTSGTVLDPGLKDWMSAIGHSSITLEQSWSRIQKVTPKPGVDPTGKPVTITPKVWMSSTVGGQTLPATVSFEQKCGRVLFSSYHAEGDSASQLLAQEKALLFILLEVGVCVGQLPPAPPPR